MEPKKHEVKREGTHKFQEAKNPESSSSLLEFDVDGKGHSDGNQLSLPEYACSPNNSTQAPPWNMSSASPSVGVHSSTPLSNASVEPSILGLVVKPPPAQATGQPDGHDPNRIPASIFSIEPNREWSIASNDSLFSIQNSFSRNSSFLCSIQEELQDPDEWNNTQSDLSEAKHNEFSRLSVDLHPLLEMPAHEERSAKSGNASSHGKKDSSGSTKIPKGETVETQAKAKMHPAEVVRPPGVITIAPNSRGALAPETIATSSSTPRTSTGNAHLSDESRTSISSFAFPVLVKDGTKSASIKWAIVEPHLQEQVPEEPHKASKKNWCCCFPCWYHCCCYSCCCC